MARQKRSSEVPTDRAIQYSDFDRQGQGAVRNIMREQGNVASHLGAAVATARAAADNPGNTSDVRHKNDIKAQKLEQSAPYVSDKPITLQGASNRRVQHFENGIQRSRAEGVDSGAGWYFDHHAAFAESAEAHGETLYRSATAGAMMSPQNSPDNERAATEAHLARRAGNPHNEKDLNRTGVGTNLKKAEAFLDGGPDIDPLGGPKIHSYRGATVNATTDSPVHDEYMARVNHAANVISGDQVKGQQRLDLHGLMDSREGILNPAGNTAEDTWMNAITYGQDLGTTLPGSKTNVGKLVGSDKKLALDIPKKDSEGVSVHPAGPVGSSAVLHAYNNEATIRAARKVGEMTDTTDSQGRSNLPAVAMQEVSWTEARRVANKDPEYASEMRDRAKAARPPGRKPTKPGKMTGQTEMFPKL